MPDDATLQAEVTRLRAEVEAYRERELADLRAALAAARQEAAHYRAEAERNVSIGHEIAREYQAQIAALRAEIDAFRKVDAHAKRFG